MNDAAKSDPILEAVREAVRQSSLDPSIPLADTTNLFGESRIDSFGLIDLLERLDRAFGIRIPAEEITNESFESVESIARLVRRHSGKGE